MTCLKVYACTVTHTIFPLKYVMAYFLFHNFLLVGGSCSFYIILLIVCFVFLAVDCFGLQEMFEGWDHIELHQIENCLPVFLEPEDVDFHHTRDPIF